jgi:hypothetical protein
VRYVVELSEDEVADAIELFLLSKGTLTGMKVATVDFKMVDALNLKLQASATLYPNALPGGGRD